MALAIAPRLMQISKCVAELLGLLGLLILSRRHRLAAVLLFFVLVEGFARFSSNAEHGAVFDAVPD